MTELAEWYNRGQRNGLRNVLVHAAIMFHCRRTLSKEQFEELADYIISQAPDSRTYKELVDLKKWDPEKERVA